MADLSYNLRPVWDGILDLYERFDAYCKKYKLRYYVTGGTLLGAVRHDGFIPWDDDFDVVMPRPDYQRFVHSMLVRPSLDMRLTSLETDIQWPNFFAKVSDSRNDVVSRIKKASRLALTDGICIDVIPIDGFPRSNVGFWLWGIKRTTWRHLGESSVKWKILSALLWPRRKSKKDYQRWLASFPYESSRCVEDVNASRKRYIARELTAKSFGVPVYHKFDRLRVPMPVEWDKFLRLIFGDYMALPPEDQRHPKHQVF